MHDTIAGRRGFQCWSFDALVATAVSCGLAQWRSLEADRSVDALSALQHTLGQLSLVQVRWRAEYVRTRDICNHIRFSILLDCCLASTAAAAAPLSVKTQET